ncbi:hypothetical protein BKA81DRAFT_419533, partial [Phyllosticta paracitricarpa]
DIFHPSSAFYSHRHSWFALIFHSSSYHKQQQQLDHTPSICRHQESTCSLLPPPPAPPTSSLRRMDPAPCGTSRRRTPCASSWMVWRLRPSATDATSPSRCSPMHATAPLGSTPAGPVDLTCTHSPEARGPTRSPSLTPLGPLRTSTSGLRPRWPASCGPSTPQWHQSSRSCTPRAKSRRRRSLSARSSTCARRQLDGKRKGSTNADWPAATTTSFSSSAKTSGPGTFSATPRRSHRIPYATAGTSSRPSASSRPSSTSSWTTGTSSSARTAPSWIGLAMSSCCASASCCVWMRLLRISMRSSTSLAWRIPRCIFTSTRTSYNAFPDASCMEVTMTAPRGRVRILGRLRVNSCC